MINNEEKKKYFRDKNPISIKYRALLLQEYDSDTFTIDWLCEETGLSRKNLTKWAASEGLTRRSPRWTRKADQYLEDQYFHMRIEDIAAELGRSQQGIIQRAKKLGITKKAEGYTLTSLAEALGCTQPTVHRWIKNGWLKAVPRNTDMHHDWWYISNEALKLFMRKYPREIDLEKLSRVPGGNVWLIDVLLGDTLKIGLGY